MISLKQNLRTTDSRLSRAVGLLLLAAIGIWSMPSQAHANSKEATPEYQLKAALLFKLTRFISWPEDAKAAERFNICIVGENVFADALEPLRSRDVEGRPIGISYFSQSEAIDTGCQIIFIEQSKQRFLSSILDQVANTGVLTISDIPDFAESGGVVELTLVNNKVGFKINLGSARAAELSMAAPLLQLSTIIDPESE